MGENGSSRKLILGIIVIVIVLVLVIGGVTAALLLMGSSGDDKTDEQNAEGVIGDFINAYQKRDMDTLKDLIMDEDGNFFRDSNTEELDDFIEFYTEDETQITEWEIEKVEKTSWSANNTGPIYLFTITIKTKNSETNEIESDTDPMMVAQNIESGKWGLALDGFDFDLEADDFEVDNNTSSATVITPGKSEEHNIHVNSDEDWFTFTLNSDEEVKIWVYGEYGGDTEIFLYTPEDAPDDYLEFNDDRDEDLFSEIMVDLSNGIYFVKVIGFDNDETIIEYTLEMEIIS